STHIYYEYKFLNLNVRNLEVAFNKLLRRHIALRSIFEDGGQRFLKETPYYKIKVFEFLSEDQILSVRRDLSHKVYNPENYPLFDIVVSKVNNYYILHISFDVLIIDANSLNI